MAKATKRIGVLSEISVLGTGFIQAGKKVYGFHYSMLVPTPGKAVTYAYTGGPQPTYWTLAGRKVKFTLTAGVASNVMVI